MQNKFIFILAFGIILSACQGQPPPVIRYGDITSLEMSAVISKEVLKALIIHGLGNQFEEIRVSPEDALDGLITEKYDLALLTGTPSTSRIPDQCLNVKNSVLSFGLLGFSTSTQKVARCDLSAKAKEVFDLLSNLKISNESTDDAISWMQNNNATAYQGALHYLHHNCVGEFGYSQWLTDSQVKRVKAAILKEMQSSQLPTI